MTRRNTAQSHRIAAVTLSCIAAATLVTACGAGQAPLTSREKTAVQGLNLQQGSVKVLNAALVLDATTGASSMHLQAVMLNTGSMPDTLESVTSTAGQVQLSTNSKQVSSIALPSSTPVSFTAASSTASSSSTSSANNSVDFSQVTPPAAVGTYVPVIITFTLGGQLETSLPVLAAESN